MGGGEKVIREGGLIEDLQQLYITRFILAVTFSKRSHIVSYWRCFATQQQQQHQMLYSLKKERYIVYIYYKTS